MKSPGNRRVSQPESKRDSAPENPVHAALARIELRLAGSPANVGDQLEQKLLKIQEAAWELLANRPKSTEAIVTALRAIRDLANGAIDSASLPAVDHEPTMKWRERPRDLRRISPATFVATHYPTYGTTLSQSDIRRLDKPLYDALLQLKNKSGWPEGFHLPTLREINDAAARAVGASSLAGAENLTPAEIRNRKRLGAAIRRRRSSR